MSAKLSDYRDGSQEEGDKEGKCTPFGGGIDHERRSPALQAGSLLN